MKTANSEMELAAELLYGSVEEQTSSSNLSQSDDIINIFGPPSLIKGAGLEDPEEIAKAAYNHGYSDGKRLYQHDDYQLTLFRETVDEIRKEKIKRGEIEPSNKQERKWRLGL